MADVAGDISTTASIGVGGTVSDSLEIAGDHDWYRIDLTQGQEITVILNGITLTDPYLRIRDSAGNVIYDNDDGGPGLNSAKSFAAPTTGTYYIDVGAFNNQGSGTYQLSVTPFSYPPIFTNDQIADQLRAGYWEGDVHHFAVGPGGSITVNLTALTAAGQTLAIAALQDWTDITGIQFTQVATGGQITFDDNQPGAFTNATWSGGITSSAHVNVSTQWLNQYGTYIGSYSFQTYIHEIGHALGLGHAGNYNVTAAYPYDALFRNDSWASSVMSYFDPTENGYTASLGFTGNELVTPMVADIIAISQMYGLSTTTRTGDTTYGFHSTAGQPWFDATQFGNVAYTIYDSGGIDTLDYSGFTLNQVINLNPETFSNVGANIGNVSIARGVVIENAIGGWGDDTLIGNSANNVLDGGPGFNTISYAWASAAVTVDTSIVGPQNTGGAGVDTLLNYVRLNGSPFDDTLIGRDGTSNQQVGLHGEGGNDTLIASGDGDNLYGDAGNDTLIGSAAGDMLDGGDGNDTFWAADGNDTIYAGNGNDTLTGGLGSDYLLGGAGADTFIDTAAGLSGDTISDLEAYERIVITDDVLSSFTFSVSGNTLNYTGGSLTFNAFFFGHWAYDAAPSGGVEIWRVNQNDHHPANDFNVDGRSDVLWRSDTGELTNWLGSGSGGFGANGANAYTIVPTDWHIAGTGDFDGDGRDDILWRNDNGTITDWIANASGNGGFAASTTFSTTVTNAWHVVGVGDFDGDRRDDILWRNDDGTITDWLSNSSGTFSASTTFSTYVPTDWHVVGTGDFNGDGRDDILWRNDNGQLTDWLRSASGSFQSNVFSVYVPTDWSVAATGDFNGDGYSDILWRQDTGQLTDWLGSASGTLSDNGANASIFVPANWQVVSVGDFNGDTRDDILWRNSNGQITEWLGTTSGGFTDNSPNAAAFVPTDWHVVNDDGGLH